MYEGTYIVFGKILLQGISLICSDNKEVVNRRSILFLIIAHLIEIV